MNVKIKAVFFIFLLVAVISCSPKITGTWNIDRYETSGPGRQKLALEHIGTLKFMKNGEGEKNLRYNIFGTDKVDQSPFGWHLTGNWLGIESRESELSRTWIITERKKRSQKWKSTDASAGIQVIEISK